MAHDASIPSPADLVATYGRGVADLRAAVAGLTPAQLQARPVPGKWSTHEVVCHLADAEAVLADRMKRVIAMDNPLLIGFDESAFVARLAYEHRELGEELALIAAVRGQMLRVLPRLAPGDWERSGVHNEAGKVSLRDLVHKANWHLAHHLKFVHEKRAALGVR